MAEGRCHSAIHANIHGGSRTYYLAQLSSGGKIVRKPKMWGPKSHKRSIAMVTEAGKWMDTQKQIRQALGGSDKAPLDERTTDRLRSLGYLGGTK